MTQSGTALAQSATATGNSQSATDTGNTAPSTARQASVDAAEAVEKSGQTLAETGAIDDKVEQAIDDAISGVTIPGLSMETVTGALGYTPYDAETNGKGFATKAEVAGAIAAIPGTVQRRHERRDHHAATKKPVHEWHGPDTSRHGGQNRIPTTSLTAGSGMHRISILHRLNRLRKRFQTFCGMFIPLISRLFIP